MRRVTIAISAAFVLAAMPAASAQGASHVTLGFTQSSNTACAAANTVDVQTAVGPGVNSYTVPPGGGVITAWQHSARDIDGALLKFKVLRPGGPLVGPAPFYAVGESAFMSVAEPIDHNFATRIPVNAGDRIGLATAANAAASPPACNTGTSTTADEVYEGADFALGGTSTLSPFNNFRLNVSATLEPDADCDGFGDETQDKSIAKSCAPAKKKCKKKKKKKSKTGAAAKKKKCKKKKKKGK
jgi:hypothetical protein